MGIDKSEIAPLLKFESLDEFIKGKGNFHWYFVDRNNNSIRRLHCYQRFKKKYKNLDKLLTKFYSCKFDIGAEATKNVNFKPVLIEDDEFKKKIGNMEKQEKREIYKKLFEAYKLMSQLVYRDDKFVVSDGKVNELYLIR